MKNILGRFRTYVTKSRIWRWWTLDNWKDAADVAFKFTAIIGAIAAANFFVLKPETDWTVTYCLMLNKSLVQDFYAQEGEIIPSSVYGLNEVLACDVDYLPSDTNSAGTFGDVISESPAQAYADALALASIPDLEKALPDDVEVLFRDRFELTSESWDGLWIEFVPAIAGQLLALHGDLTIDQLEQALNAVESAVYYRASLVVSNVGQATARAVEINEPDNWLLQEDSDSDFDLPVGVRRKFVYRASKESVENQSRSDGTWSNAGSTLLVWPGLATPTFYVTSESSEILDTNALYRIGLVLLALWVIIVAKDIVASDQASSARLGN
jgi:hypothetical protein